MHKFFKSTWLDFEVIRILGTAPNGGAEICEVLEAVGSITEGDAESWYQAWHAQAARAEATGLRCLQCKHRELARRAFLRAANYTRASGYMLTGPTPSQQDPRGLPIAEKAIQLFRRGVQLSRAPVEFLEIPYPGGVHLQGYLYLPPATRRPGVPPKTPILLNCGGADSTQEELYFLHPCAATEHGYACLTFDGPGQGMALRRHGLVLRPDWESVTRHVLDHLTTLAAARPAWNLDLDRIAVSGSALGGYFALRVASDPRIKACVALDPVHDMWDFGTQHVSRAFMKAWTDGWVSNATVDAMIGFAARRSFQMHWEVSLAGAIWQLDRPTDILLRMKQFTLKGGEGEGGGFLARVHCPTLVSGAADFLYLDVDSHTMMVWRGLQHLPEKDRTLWMAETPADGALQAKIGAFGLSNEYTFAFLDEKLGMVRDALEAEAEVESC
ncbi:hydrolase psoB [Aspergillus saccharolyticus JOP 1030-1]|uniref:Alpha/beta-hydrolase n=1 Tax=Aspergillus saccharolyticus JOP 1030-1 TaxID=1450539 RepID=A0A318Z5Q0_9EURO|nr:alpha/beta-hydrolase [Aspergillus saccharolyticus JOP 1030-1]PYH42429.1 alpha/beta-hydrolase [Aspergillus saccharolyticus JOP 1030-1]